MVCWGNALCDKIKYHMSHAVIDYTILGCKVDGKPGAVFFQWLSMVSANDRRCYRCYIFFHWSPSSDIDRKQTLIEENLTKDIIEYVLVPFIINHLNLEDMNWFSYLCNAVKTLLSYKWGNVPVFIKTLKAILKKKNILLYHQSSQQRRP